MASTACNETVLLTGISGSLGSWLAAYLVRRGYKIVALVRDGRGLGGKQRIEQVYRQLDFADVCESITSVDGDITRPNLGLEPDEPALEGVTRILHCAACTNFRDQFSQATYDTNVTGTRHVLELALQMEVPLVYVSTAYVAGKRDGRVTEDEVNLGQAFNNAYEYTKCLAEEEVHAWSQRTGLETMVLRPSIVLGDSRHGRTVRFNSMYDLLRVLDMIVPHKSGALLHIPAQSQATKNIIPVDYFTEVACRLIEHGAPGTYHITHQRPVLIERLAEIMCILFGQSPYEWVQPESNRARSADEVEELIQQIITSYAPYVEKEPVFDTTNTDRVLQGAKVNLPKLDVDYFEKILDYARKANWGKNRKVPAIL